MNEGFVVNDQKVLKVFGNHQIGDISYSEQQSTRVEEGIVDLDHGSRFEGLVLTDEKEGKMGIPFGYGEMYDDNGLLLYKGIMINWQRFGYGTRVVGEWRMERDFRNLRQFSVFFYFSSKVTPQTPQLQDTRKSIFYQITAVNFFFDHFWPFSTIACLAASVSTMGNARSPFPTK